MENKWWVIIQKKDFEFLVDKSVLGYVELEKYAREYVRSTV